MFLFISAVHGGRRGEEIFQYISCSYSSTFCCYPQLVIVISIHLMFLFIRSEAHDGIICFIFQYISCSYSSVFFPFSSRRPGNFNTSHVLIHLIEGNGEGAVWIFQYISCSYSSESGEYEYTCGGLFQYISCSYSSLHCRKQR